MSTDQPDRRAAAAEGAARDRVPEDRVREEADRVRDEGLRDAPRSEPVDRPASAPPITRDHVVAREKERFGGFKFGSAFFGWLTATGTAVILTALVAAVGAVIGLTNQEAVDDAARTATQNSVGATILAAVVIGVVLFVAYFAGGYVAGRMARFDGAKQGLAVWLWAVVVAVVVAVVTAIAGSQWDVLAAVNSFPRIPVTPESATATGILTAVGAAVVTLIAAVLGGLAGMRYHRKVDRVGLEGVPR